MSLSPFDQAFRDDALPAIYAEFGEAMSYTPPGGSVVEGVLVIPDEQDRQHSAGEYGQMRSAERVWSVQIADPALAAAGVTPVRDGVLTRSDGERLMIDGAPRSHDGEWLLDLVATA